jgi:hypothetical protein
MKALLQNTYIQEANRAGLFLAILFALCFAWFYIRPVEQNLHTALFRMAYVGFEGMNIVGFILGAAQTYIWGYLFLGIWRFVEKVGR